MAVTTTLTLRGDAIKKDRPVIDRLIEENLNGKLDSYLKWPEATQEVKLIITLSEGKRGFAGSLDVNVHGKSLRFAREDFHKLDDLVNHLFSHLKEELSHK